MHLAWKQLPSCCNCIDFLATFPVGLNRSILLTVDAVSDYEKLCALDVLGLADLPAEDQLEVYKEFREQLTRNERDFRKFCLIELPLDVILVDQLSATVPQCPCRSSRSYMRHRPLNTVYAFSNLYFKFLLYL